MSIVDHTDIAAAELPALGLAPTLESLVVSKIEFDMATRVPLPEDDDDWIGTDIDTFQPSSEDKQSYPPPNLDDAFANAVESAPAELEIVTMDVFPFTDFVFLEALLQQDPSDANPPRFDAPVADEDALKLEAALDSLFQNLAVMPKDIGQSLIPTGAPRIDGSPASDFLAPTHVETPLGIADASNEAKSLEDALSASISSETVKAAPSPSVDSTAVRFLTCHCICLSTSTADTSLKAAEIAIDLDETTCSTELAKDTEAVEDADNSEDVEGCADVPGRPTIKVDFLAALIDLTDNEELDERSEAVHATLEASQLRNNAQINILNRFIDELEADKTRLCSALSDLESKQLLSEDRICSLTADVCALSTDRGELRGALAKVKAAYAVARVKTEADKTRITELKSKLVAIEAQLQRLRHDHHEAQTTISMLSHSLDEHKSALEDAQAQNQGLHSQMYEEREIAQGTRDHLATVQNALVDIKGQLEEQIGCARDGAARQDQLETALEEARSRIADALGRAQLFEEQATGAAEAYDALYRDNEALSSRLRQQERLAREVQRELATVEGQKGMLEAEVVVTKRSLAATHARVQEAARELQETRSALHRAECEQVELKHISETAHASASALSTKVNTLENELSATKTALSALEDRNIKLGTQLEDERKSLAARITVVEQDAQERLKQHQVQHQEELEAAKDLAKEREAMYRAEIAKLQDLLAQTNTAFNHVLVQTSVLAERDEAYLATQTALARERRAAARKEDEIKRLRQENAGLKEQLSIAERTSFKLDEELGSLISRINVVSEEKRVVEAQLAEKSVVIGELREVNQRMGCQMEGVREQLAALYDEHEATRSLSEVSIDEVRQLKNDFEEQTCETLEIVLTEKEQLRMEKKVTEKELVRVRRESQVKIDSLEKDNSELRLALKKKPQSAELYETKKLVGVYTERIANCTQCAVISTPAARFKSRGKENAGGADDSLFGVSVDNILAK